VSLGYIRRTYRVPAFQGGLIRFFGIEYQIKSAYGSKLRVEQPLTCERLILHPTWKVEYLNESSDNWPGMNNCELEVPK